MEVWDVVVIGAGAAGLFCAIEAGRRGRRVLVIDHARKPAEKVRISGGGRCNFTNLEVAADRFWSENPHFAKSALARYTQWDFIDLVGRHGIAWHEKTLGQLFCDGSSTEIIQMLLRELEAAGGELRLETSVSGLSREGVWHVDSSRGRLRAESVVIATGGKSIPKMGATGWGYDIARQFGLEIVTPRPGLVPLTFADGVIEHTRGLAGVSVSAEVRHARAAFAEGLLFTHRGLSGPSILQISCPWREGDALDIDLALGARVGEALRAMKSTEGRITIATALGRLLPARLAGLIVAELGLRGTLGDQTAQALDAIAERVHRWRVVPTGSEGYRTAEVTLGGVSTDALDARTMQARAVPGLFFIGEVVDVTGWLGGYNFQWAWSSGWAAGQVA